MEIITRYKIDMIDCVFKNSIERREEVQVMEDKGWIVYNEYLDHDSMKVHVVFVKNIE